QVVIFEYADPKHQKHQNQDDKICDQFQSDPMCASAACRSQGERMHANRKCRASKDGTPTTDASAAAFNVVFRETMSVMVQMIELNGMHRSQHQDAEQKHDCVAGRAWKSESIVEGIVHLAKSGQKENEGNSERQRV